MTSYLCFLKRKRFCYHINIYKTNMPPCFPYFCKQTLGVVTVVRCHLTNPHKGNEKASEKKLDV